MPNPPITIRLPAELLTRIDAHGRGRQDFIRAAIDYYLAHLARGTEAEVLRRVEKVALMDAEGNVIKVI